MCKLITEPRINTRAETGQHTANDQWQMHVSVVPDPGLNAMAPSQCNSDIAAHLRALGLSPKLAGYRCLLTAIPMYAENPWLMMKEVYPVIARSYGFSDWRCVERVIRSAIGKAWRNRNASVWSVYFPVNRQGDIDRPGNKEFIAQLVEKL